MGLHPSPWGLWEFQLRGSLGLIQRVKRGERGAAPAPRGIWSGMGKMLVGAREFCATVARGTQCHPPLGRSSHRGSPSDRRSNFFCPWQFIPAKSFPTVFLVAERI